MIPVQIYSLTYYIILSCFVFLFGYLRLWTSNNAKLDNGFTNSRLSTALLCIIILFIGLRNPYASSNFLGDTGAYTLSYENINTVNLSDEKDIGFSILMKISAFLGFPVQFFYVICAFLYVIPPYIAFKKWFREKAFYALLIYVTAMSFWAFGINGVRNGLATSVFIYSLSFTDKKWLMYLFMLIAVSFHKSLLLPTVIFILFFFLKVISLKKMIGIWFLSIFISSLYGERIKNLISPLLYLLQDDRAGIYTNENEALADFASVTFRYDFVLYSAAPILLGYLYIYIKKYQNKFYLQLLNTYIILNAIWILFFIYVPFTNRYAFLSWFLMPVIMIYPLLKGYIIKRQYYFIRMLIICNLLFTLIMFFK